MKWLYNSIGPQLVCDNGDFYNFLMRGNLVSCQRPTELRHRILHTFAGLIV
jgi:hypothetical protein